MSLATATATALPLSPRIESGPSDAVVSYGTPLEKKKPATLLHAYNSASQRSKASAFLPSFRR